MNRPMQTRAIYAAQVPLPDASGREAILSAILRTHCAQLAGQGRHPSASIDPQLLLNKPSPALRARPLQLLAAKTPGFSGSDLRALCARAVNIAEYDTNLARVATQAPGGLRNERPAGGASSSTAGQPGPSRHVGGLQSNSHATNRKLQTPSQSQQAGRKTDASAVPGNGADPGAHAAAMHATSSHALDADPSHDTPQAHRRAASAPASQHTIHLAASSRPPARGPETIGPEPSPSPRRLTLADFLTALTGFVPPSRAAKAERVSRPATAPSAQLALHAAAPVTSVLVTPEVAQFFFDMQTTCYAVLAGQAHQSNAPGFTTN